MSNTPQDYPSEDRSAVLYSERTIHPVIGWSALVVCILSFVIGLFVHVGVFLFAMIGTIVVLTVLSENWYNGLELTNQELRVGRGKVALGDLDPAFSVRRAGDVFDAGTMASFEVGGRSNRFNGQLRFLGGAWGSGVFHKTRLVVVRQRSTQQMLLFKVKEYKELQNLLATALSQHGAPDTEVKVDSLFPSRAELTVLDEILLALEGLVFVVAASATLISWISRLF